MAIVVRADDPDHLLDRIVDAIDAGRVRTWSYDADGDFTHRADQWRGAAWLHPRVDSARGRLIFSIVRPTGTRITKTIYGVYHGRFIEMLLTHFDEEMEDVRATPLPSYGDES